MTARKPSDLELQVLSVLWDRGPSTAREVLGAMPDGKERAYTTVLSVLQGMERKKLVAHEVRGVAHVYRPKVTQRQTLGPLLRGLVRNVFGGCPSAAMQHLLNDAELSQEELARIRALLDAHTPQPAPEPEEGSST